MHGISEEHQVHDSIDLIVGVKCFLQCFVQGLPGWDREVFGLSNACEDERKEWSVLITYHTYVCMFVCVNTCYVQVYANLIDHLKQSGRISVAPLLMRHHPNPLRKHIHTHDCTYICTHCNTLQQIYKCIPQSCLWLSAAATSSDSPYPCPLSSCHHRPD